MSTYLEILALQPPFEMTAATDNDRAVFGFNLQCTVQGAIVNFEGEMVKLITDAALGTTNVDTFIGTKRQIPTDDGPYIVVIATGGFEPDETHNGNRYDKPTCQISVWGRSYETVRVKCLALYHELDGKRMVTVTA